MSSLQSGPVSHSVCGSGSVSMTHYPVCVSFEVSLEIHNRAQFQKDGHFVCGLKDLNGHERPWEGELLYVMTLWHMQGAQHWGNGTPQHLGEGHNTPVQVLRVMGDSPEVASQLMADGIRANLNAYAMLLEVKREADKTAQQESKDFAACRAKLDEISGPGSAVEAIRAARIRELVG